MLEVFLCICSITTERCSRMSNADFHSTTDHVHIGASPSQRKKEEEKASLSITFSNFASFLKDTCAKEKKCKK